MKICLDAGHGFENRVQNRYDPGRVAEGVAEADIVLQWALTGKWVLTQLGIATFLTRDDDSDSVPVASRDNRATAAGCTHFLSLHCNGFSNRAVSGTETFYRGSEDLAWAQLVHKCGLKTLNLYNRGLKTEDQSQQPRLAVLDFVGPGCLLELGFITHTVDRSRMQSRERRIMFWQTLGQEVKAMK